MRSFSSAGDGERVVDATPGMREWQMERAGTPGLGSTAGLHRFNWDLRMAGPWDSRERARGRQGPLVAPGLYRIVLIAGGETL